MSILNKYSTFSPSRGLIVLRSQIQTRINALLRNRYYRSGNNGYYRLAVMLWERKNYAH